MQGSWVERMYEEEEEWGRRYQDNGGVSKAEAPKHLIGYASLLKFFQLELCTLLKVLDQITLCTLCMRRLLPSRLPCISETPPPHNTTVIIQDVKLHGHVAKCIHELDDPFERMRQH